MKIKKVKWKSHPILGDLELDFTNSDTGEPFDNILFAGENGTGKTTILETINRFLNGYTFDGFEYIEYVTEGKNLKAVPSTNPDEVKRGFYVMVEENGVITKMNTGKENSSSSTSNPTVDNNPLNIRYSGSVLSKARADFQTKKITSTTTQELDSFKSSLDDSDDFTSLKQLIIDIENQDNSEYRKINKTRDDNPISEKDFCPTSKIYRFRNAFNSFFDKIQYNGTDDINGEKQILFIKNDINISIDRLSTGEKQIVYRGAYLLRNSNNLSGATIMIDEPELSMHPKWQEKILQYYKNLFTERDTGIQKAQLFFASHSDRLLKKALSDRDSNKIIALIDNNGKVEPKYINTTNTLSIITYAETNYLVFDIISIDYHIELYSCLQDITHNEFSVRDCDNYIEGHDLYDSTKHYKDYSFTDKNGNIRTYNTLPVVHLSDSSF